jgi:acetyl esterase/lipase
MQIVRLAAGAENICESTEGECVAVRIHHPELYVYPVEKPAARVLVCPGGGYTRLMLSKEGAEIAAWLGGLGYEASVLIHRLPGADGHPHDIALTDGLLALDYLKRDLPLFIMGLSSGGHLAMVLASQRPVAGVLAVYAPLNGNHRDHKVPSGKPDFAPPEKQAFYNDWPVGISVMPSCPVFLVYGLHDGVVPVENALRFISAARDAGIDLDAHIFGTAPHGFALRHVAGTHAVWPELAACWIEVRCPAG